MGYKEKQASRARDLGKVLGDKWLCRGCNGVFAVNPSRMGGLRIGTEDSLLHLI